MTAGASRPGRSTPAPGARPDHRRPRPADLPDHRVRFRDTEHAAALFGLAEPGNIYTRIMNPTQDVVEERIAALEGGVAALLVGSGQAATSAGDPQHRRAPATTRAPPRLYGGTYNLLHHTLPKLGIEVTFVEDPDDPEAVAGRRPPEHEGVLRRDDRQPARATSSTSRASPASRTSRRAADRRQHDRDAVPDPAARVRRRHRRALGDEVPRRARHRDRRRDRRRRQVRLGGERRAVPRLHHARPELPRRRLHRGLGAGRVHHSRRGCSCCATSARRSPRSTRSSSRRGSRRCRCGSSGTSRTRQRVAEWLEARDEVESVNYAGLPSLAVVRAQAEVRCRAAPARCSPSSCTAGSRPAGGSSTP